LDRNPGDSPGSITGIARQLLRETLTEGILTMNKKLNIPEFGKAIYPLALGRLNNKDSYDPLNIHPVKTATPDNFISPLKVEVKDTLNKDYEFPFTDEITRLDAISRANEIIREHNVIAKAEQRKRIASLKPGEWGRFSGVPIDYPPFDPYRIYFRTTDPNFQRINGQAPYISNKFLFTELISRNPLDFVKHFNKTMIDYCLFEESQTEDPVTKQIWVKVRQRFLDWFRSENIIPEKVQGFVNIKKPTKPGKFSSYKWSDLICFVDQGFEIGWNADSTITFKVKGTNIQETYPITKLVFWNEKSKQPTLSGKMFQAIHLLDTSRQDKSGTIRKRVSDLRSKLNEKIGAKENPIESKGDWYSFTFKIQYRKNRRTIEYRDDIPYKITGNHSTDDDLLEQARSEENQALQQVQNAESEHEHKAALLEYKKIRDERERMELEKNII